MTNLSKNKVRNNILKLGSSNLNSENWEVYHPNGTHMFTCGEKKAKWYLDRDLAKRMDDSRIILSFEPKGDGFDKNEIFGKSVRKAICVVSGIGNDLQRHHIVPYCYRSYFPKEYKSKNHHDVVLINCEKHSEYEQQATIYKNVIAEMYCVKTINDYNLNYTEKLREIGKDSAILLNTINSIFRGHNKMSIDIKYKKIKIISERTGINFDVICNYNYIQLYKLFTIIRKEHEENVYQYKVVNRKYYDHGYHLVQKLNTEEKIKEFVKLWRKHFIDIMQPKFMPLGWSINFRVKTNI